MQLQSAQVLSYSDTRAEAPGLGVALKVKASRESEVAGCLIWRSLSSPDSNSRNAGCRAGTMLYCSGFVAADQTSFFAARVKQWHQSGRWMCRGCACWKHGPGTFSAPPAARERLSRRLEREE